MVWGLKSRSLGLNCRPYNGHFLFPSLGDDSGYDHWCVYWGNDRRKKREIGASSSMGGADRKPVGHRAQALILRSHTVLHYQGSAVIRNVKTGNHRMSQYTDLDETRTIRQRIIDLLSEHQLTARELSQAIGIREREIYGHLDHVARSTAAQRKKLVVDPARCLACGYVFENRKRLTRPSRCPRCKLSHLQEPTYHVA